MNDNYRKTAALAAVIAVSLAQACVAADVQSAVPSAAVKQLMDKDMVGEAGKELLMLTVEYPPGGSSQPHRHDAQVMVYVLEGEITMQVSGSPAVTLRPGQTFYENPADVHLVSANASKTAPAKILVFMLKNKSAPVSRAVSSKGSP